MSTDAAAARAPKRARGKQRVAQLLRAAAEVFADRGFDAATMTEIAARAGAPIGSLYQFFPVKESLADTLVRDYAALLSSDLQALRARAASVDIDTLIDALFGLLRGHAREQAVALSLAEVRMDDHARRKTFRHMFRKHIAAILRAHAPALSAQTARDMAVMLLELMKVSAALGNESGLSRRGALQRELQAMAVGLLMRTLEQR